MSWGEDADEPDLAAPGPFVAELVYVSPTDIDAAVLGERLARREPTGIVEDGGDGTCMVRFPGTEVEVDDQRLPYAVTVIRSGSDPQARFDPASARDLAAQSWAWKDAAQAIADGQYSVLVTDPHGGRQPRERRVWLFREALAALVETTHPIALIFRKAHHVVEPGDFLDAVLEDRAPLFGLVNVRMFRIGDHSDDRFVMDTVGMAPLGLPDVQCHFIGLEPKDVARLLLSLARYLFRKGDVIDDGHTVGGVEKGTRWSCQHEESLVAPTRIVLDVEPEPPHGGR